jgi:HipA-like protein
MKARVYRNHDLAGELERKEDGTYRFVYREDYLKDPSKPAISLTLPKRRDAYESTHLFPFFFNMLSEGVNLKLQSRALKIDEQDYFQLLLSTAQYDTIGAVRVAPIDRDA